MKLPLFNSTYRGFTKRDTLGLQSLSSSIQAKICPIVNVVTPHPFYWAFLIWNYYHFYSLQENKEVSDIVFNKDFVKRNDFFFVIQRVSSEETMLQQGSRTKTLTEYLTMTKHITVRILEACSIITTDVMPWDLSKRTKTRLTLTMTLLAQS